MKMRASFFVLVLTLVVSACSDPATVKQQTDSKPGTDNSTASATSAQSTAQTTISPQVPPQFADVVRCWETNKRLLGAYLWRPAPENPNEAARFEQRREKLSEDDEKYQLLKEATEMTQAVSDEESASVFARVKSELDALEKTDDALERFEASTKECERKYSKFVEKY